MTNELRVGNKGFIYKQAKFETFIPFNEIIKVVKEIKGSDKYDFKIYFKSCYKSNEDIIKETIREISITEKEYIDLIYHLMNTI